VTSTPTFFINGRRIRGGIPPQYFEAAIELELKRATK
jgi:protein-disulfide isomerase